MESEIEMGEEKNVCKAEKDQNETQQKRVRRSKKKEKQIGITRGFTNLVLFLSPSHQRGERNEWGCRGGLGKRRNEKNTNKGLAGT